MLSIRLLVFWITTVGTTTPSASAAAAAAAASHGRGGNLLYYSGGGRGGRNGISSREKRKSETSTNKSGQQRKKKSGKQVVHRLEKNPNDFLYIYLYLKFVLICVYQSLWVLFMESQSPDEYVCCVGLGGGTYFALFERPRYWCNIMMAFLSWVVNGTFLSVPEIIALPQCHSGVKKRTKRRLFVICKLFSHGKDIFSICLNVARTNV